jgi:nucleotide-binding universal stress UspA family protein
LFHSTTRSKPAAFCPTSSDSPGPHILVALDGSPLAEQTLDPALRIARLLRSEVVLLRAVAHEPEAAPSAEAQTYLDLVVTQLQSAQVQATSRVSVGSPEEAITQITETLGIDLIAMATHGRSGPARVVLGSIATRTLQRATVPVLLIRPTTITPRTSGRRLTTSVAGGNDHENWS